jgi:hypothetical protein
VIDTAARIELNPVVIYRDLSEGAVLLHADSGQYHGLNPVSVMIWQFLERSGPAEFGSVVAAVESSVVDPPPETASDVSDFIEDLAARDLVVIT